MLHDFTGGSDGGYPGGTVTLGANGVWYGAASYSGVANASGVIYQLAPPEQTGGAWTETVLHTFPASKGDATAPFTTLATDQGGKTSSARPSSAVPAPAASVAGRSSSWLRHPASARGPKPFFTTWETADKTRIAALSCSTMVCCTEQPLISGLRM